jgi:hypothetical protein
MAKYYEDVNFIISPHPCFQTNQSTKTKKNARMILLENPLQNLSQELSLVIRWAPTQIPATTQKMPRQPVGRVIPDKGEIKEALLMLCGLSGGTDYD